MTFLVNSSERKHYSYILIFNITFLLGYIFRMLSYGWLMIFLLIPEFLFRSIYYIAGIFLLKKEINKKVIVLSVSLQCFYLLTSFFSFDVSMGNSFTFAQLWRNPSEHYKNLIINLWCIFALITILLIIFTFIIIPKMKSTKFRKDWIFLNPLIGIIFIPLLAFFSIAIIKPFLNLY